MRRLTIRANQTEHSPSLPTSVAQVGQQHVNQDMRGICNGMQESYCETMCSSFTLLLLKVPNVLAIAKWLHAPVPSGVLSFGEDFRPVELEVVVEGYPQHTNDFLFSRQLDSHVDDVLQTYSKGRPTLLFCSSRKGAKDACERLQTTHVVDIGQPSQARANLEAKRKEAARSISDATLRKCASLGLAWHHAQVSAADRKIVENMFQDRLISVLACKCCFVRNCSKFN